MSAADTLQCLQSVRLRWFRLLLLQFLGVNGSLKNGFQVIFITIIAAIVNVHFVF